MRALAIAVVAWASAAHADAPRTAPAGFDHNLHARDVDVANVPPLACTRCHTMRGGALAGRPDHAACFGSCHGPVPQAVRGQRMALPPERLRVCEACHAEAVVGQPVGDLRAFAVGYPPYKRDPDHALAIGHKQHRAVACTQCHAGEAKYRGPAHRRCSGCHDGTAGKGPPMTACAGCHQPASGAPEPPALIMNNQIEIVVTSAFSHARHAARGGAGRQCTTCHRAIVATDDRQLPRPTAADCATAGCHDGSAAFAVTAACTRCHRDVPTRDFKVERPETRFSHATHEQAAPDRPCAACHPLARSGAVAVVGHGPCAPCHAKDFGERRPKICGACHNATEPWRTLAPDRMPPERTEFGATLDHGKHRGACASCHSLTTATTQLRPPRNHRACVGAGCHATAGGPKPPLTDCMGCHERGLAERRAAQRIAAPWSVRAMFDHAPHARTAAGDLPCTACHTDLGAPDLISLGTPAKATCAGCHDGGAAFKLTGTTCTRCHLGAKR